MITEQQYELAIYVRDNTFKFEKPSAADREDWSQYKLAIETIVKYNSQKKQDGKENI